MCKAHPVHCPVSHGKSEETLCWRASESETLYFVRARMTLEYLRFEMLSASQILEKAIVDTKTQRGFRGYTCSPKVNKKFEDWFYYGSSIGESMLSDNNFFFHEAKQSVVICDLDERESQNTTSTSSALCKFRQRWVATKAQTIKDFPRGEKRKVWCACVCGSKCWVQLSRSDVMWACAYLCSSKLVWHVWASVYWRIYSSVLFFWFFF